MMLLESINEQFFKLFQGFSVNVRGSEILVNTRYYKASSNDYTEEQSNQKYPCIVIQDYTPVPKEDWYIDQNMYQGNTDGDSCEMVRKPMWFNVRYDVTIVTKSYFEFKDLKNQFLQKFQSKYRFIFNSHSVDGYEVGDVVPFSVSVMDVPRNDGCFEANYEFNLSAWIDIEETKNVPVVQSIGIDII